MYRLTLSLIGGDLPRLCFRVGFDVGATGGVLVSMDIVPSTENKNDVTNTRLARKQS